MTNLIRDEQVLVVPPVQRRRSKRIDHPLVHPVQHDRSRLVPHDPEREVTRQESAREPSQARERLERPRDDLLVRVVSGSDSTRDDLDKTDGERRAGGGEGSGRGGEDGGSFVHHQVTGSSEEL